MLEFNSDRARLISVELTEYYVCKKENPGADAIILQANLIDKSLPEKIRPELIPQIGIVHKRSSNFQITTHDICSIYNRESRFYKQKQNQKSLPAMNRAHEIASHAVFMRWKINGGKKYDGREMFKYGVDKEPSELEKDIFRRQCLEQAEKSTLNAEKWKRLAAGDYPPDSKDWRG